MELRSAVRSLPFAQSMYALLRLLRGRNARFVADYQSNSGVGSTIEATTAISQALPKLLASLELRSMLDLPCGDFVWMRNIDLGSINYTGADIIESLIQSHQLNYSSPRRTFKVLDVIKDDLPRVDVVFCRDCLVHFSERLVRRAIRNIKRSNSKYLLTTTFPAQPANAPIVTGSWRPINLCAEPFNFPPPLKLLLEENEPPYADKSIGLWRVQDIPAV